jgi:AcrR family transcriptional regulator/DNA-binding MarR family transcriptional regulator
MSSLVATRRGPAVASAGHGRTSGGIRASATRSPSTRPSSTRPSGVRSAASTARTATARQPATRPSRTVRRQPGAPKPSHVLPAEIQRNRLVSAAIRSLDEVGYVYTSVAQISSRARVSRRTFYELFADREACMLAVFADVLGLIERDLAAAAPDGLPWRERVRGGLWTILSFFEREPVMARLLVVQSLQGDARILQEREALLARLAAVVDEGRNESAKAAHATPLTAEGLVGAALTIVYTRLMRSQHEPLTSLLGELMSLIVLPYLGTAAARQERKRKAPASISLERSGSDRDGGAQATDARFDGAHEDPLRGVPIRLTYRTVCVLEVLAEHPGLSNRGVGERSGISDQGQISKLLSRLERYGLVENSRDADARGEANAWTLTQTGVRIVHSILAHTPNRRDAVPQRDRHDA